MCDVCVYVWVVCVDCTLQLLQDVSDAGLTAVVADDCIICYNTD